MQQNDGYDNGIKSTIIITNDNANYFAVNALFIVCLLNVAIFSQKKIHKLD